MKQQTKKQYSHYIHRTSYQFHEKIVGAFVLAAMIILLMLLFSLLKKQDFFEDYFVIYGRLNSAVGLSTETNIQISGFNVGRVSNLEITDNNDILLTLSVAKRYQRLIRSDSVVKVSSLNATIIGSSIIEITAGSPSQAVIEEGYEFVIQESTSVATVIAEALSTLETVNKVVHDVSVLVSSVNPDHIKNTVSSLQQMAENLGNLSDQMTSGQGMWGTIMYDQSVADGFKQSVTNLEQATVKLNEMLSNANVNVEQVPAILDDVQSVINETKETIDATQRVWPISSAIGKSDDTKTVVEPVPVK